MKEDRVITQIILHHSATKDSGTVSWNAIRRYHVRECGWNDIGYHFGIELISDPLPVEVPQYEILMGRSPLVAGAHTTGQNHDSIGVCFVGNFDLDPVPMPQWNKGVKLVAWLLRVYSLTFSDIHGHNEYAKKTCPGKNFNVSRFKEEVALWL